MKSELDDLIAPDADELIAKSSELLEESSTAIRRALQNPAPKTADRAIAQFVLVVAILKRIRSAVSDSDEA